MPSYLHQQIRQALQTGRTSSVVSFAHDFPEVFRDVVKDTHLIRALATDGHFRSLQICCQLPVGSVRLASDECCMLRRTARNFSEFETFIQWILEASGQLHAILLENRDWVQQLSARQLRDLMRIGYGEPPFDSTQSITCIAYILEQPPASDGFPLVKLLRDFKVQPLLQEPYLLSPLCRVAAAERMLSTLQELDALLHIADAQKNVERKHRF